MTPCGGALNNLWNPVRSYLCALDGIQHGFLVIENLHSAPATIPSISAAGRRQPR